MDESAEHTLNELTTAGPGAGRATASLCVLASGSSGNCTVLAVWTCGQRRLCLIDAGLSPRRTERRLGEMGLGMDALDGILLTHLDDDHYHGGWNRRLPAGARVHLHHRHAHRARRCGIDGRLAAFDGVFELCPGVRVSPALASHDDLGSVALRFEFAACGARMGFATDLGRVTGTLVEHLREVDVLALESNYCPRMQAASRRPWFLKRRIMGGAGHLSNEQALRAVEEIGPRSHVVFLHLSEECNDPALVASLHAGADYAFTITGQHRPSRWVEIAPPRGAMVRTTAMAQLPLFMMPPGPETPRSTGRARGLPSSLRA
jgi:phosphoribosyl 1,2-cyclic phosphodiesterase